MPWLVSETDGEGYTKHYRYDWAGNKTWNSTRKNEYVGTQYTYDELYRLGKVEDAENKQTTYTYDLMNNLLTQTLGGQITVTCQYDSLYRLKKKITGTLEETFDTYDASGNLKQKTGRNGISTTYAYDNLNRLLSETAGTDSRQFAYDSAGNLASTIDETGTTTYEYNALNQLDRKILPGSKIVDYDYDTEGNNTVVTDPDNNTTNYTYDAMNRLQTVTTTEGTSTYTYYANGNRETLTLPDGTVTTYQYNPRNMLTSLVNRTGGVNTTYTYQYDADGLQLYKVEPNGRTDFEYDDLGRIKKVTEPGNRITQYTYDNAGNRDTQTVDAPGLDVDYIYNIQNWLVQTVETRNGATTTAALTYDDNGNQETVTETGPSGTKVSTYEYDNFNQLKTAQTPNGEVITSKYDASGMRIEKTVNGVTSTYHYDGTNVILEETGGTHNRNIYGINLIARNDGAGALYYLYNGHGDVVKLINASGSLVNEYDYDIFGNPLLVNESRTNPFRYAGYFYDDETGYYYLNARYYDPKNARFITEDTYLGKYTDPLSLNLYTYCHNSPINAWDPTGHWIETDSKFSTIVQIELLKLTLAWYMSDSDEERTDIHNRANDIREGMSSGLSGVIDKAKSITGAAADEFSWFLGGDVSRAERDYWLTQVQKYDNSISISEKKVLNATMFLAGLLSPSPDDVAKVISKKALKEMYEEVGEKGAKKFFKAMTKYAGKQGANGIKKLTGKGIKGFMYEVKIKGVGGAYRLLGNKNDIGEIIWEIFEKTH
ncbi:MAG: RHS repeat-associated core domain-containing protein [Clostridiaceae bacterium]